MALDHLKKHPARRPLDHAAVSRILGSTTEPVEADVVQQVMRHKGGPKPKPAWPNRLPDGSVKTLQWIGGVWRGRLLVPDPPGSISPGFEVTAEQPTERECCHELHRLYCESLNAETPAAE